MNFTESLKKIADRIDDFLGIAVAGVDGIILEEYKADPLLDLSSLVAEYSAFWRGVDKATASVDLGATHEMSILTDKTVIILKKINSDYFLLLATGSEKNFGKGRFLMRKEMAALAEEL